MISTYAHLSPEIVLAVQFKASDYFKALPSYFEKLEVPFLTVAEVGPLMSSRDCTVLSKDEINFSEDDRYFE